MAGKTDERETRCHSGKTGACAIQREGEGGLDGGKCLREWTAGGQGRDNI